MNTPAIVTFCFFSLINEPVALEEKIGSSINDGRQFLIEVPGEKEVYKSAAMHRKLWNVTCSEYYDGHDISTYIDDPSMTGTCTYLLENTYEKYWAPTKNQRTWFETLSIKKQAIPKVPRIRKEIRRLSSEEFQNVVDALWELKKEKIDGMTKYDILRLMHSYYSALINHRNLALFPWHREYMMRVENAVLQVSDKVSAMPYWDTALDMYSSYAADAITWSDYFLGSSYGFITTGHFGNWPINSELCLKYTEDKPYLHRELSSTEAAGFIDDEDLVTLLMYDSYEALLDHHIVCFFTRHNNAHSKIGGVFSGHSTADNFTCVYDEPTFNFFHSWVDYDFGAFRATQRTNLETDYKYHSNGVYSLEWCAMANATMRPFDDLDVIFGLSTVYEQLQTYETRPYSCLVDGDCGSKYLYCMDGRSKCASKLKNGATCVNERSCFSGRCKGVCQT